MRTSILVCIGTLVFINVALAGRTVGTQTDADSAAIKETLLNYVQGWYEGGAARMQRALYPDLAKRIVRKNLRTGKEYLEKMTAKELITGTGTDGGCAADSTELTPKCTLIRKERQQKDITIFDVYEDEASAKVVFLGWVDYVHLARINGRWVIVNVLWQEKPESNTQ
jgi:putative lumazine-binding protein